MSEYKWTLVLATEFTLLFTVSFTKPSQESTINYQDYPLNTGTLLRLRFNRISKLFRTEEGHRIYDVFVAITIIVGEGRS